MCRTFCINECAPNLPCGETNIQTHALSVARFNETVAADVIVLLTLLVELVVVVLLVVVMFWPF